MSQRILAGVVRRRRDTDAAPLHVCRRSLLWWPHLRWFARLDYGADFPAVGTVVVPAVDDPVTLAEQHLLGPVERVEETELIDVHLVGGVASIHGDRDVGAALEDSD